jgi:hypothetical protein
LILTATDGNVQFLRTDKRDEPDDYGFDEEEDEFIDLSQLPPEQQQYFLQQHLLRY